MSGVGNKEGARRLGKGMMIGGWVLLIGLLTLLFQDQLERAVNPNSDIEVIVDEQGVREVVLERNRAGHYVASGRINGVPVVFLLDTGATDVAIPQVLADRIGLKRGPAFTSRTANGNVMSWRTVLDRVSLGSISVEGVRASILPTLLGDDEVLLGMSFLKKLELVQRDGSLTLRQY
ncbi:retropepsin-like aspartic protease family protein [Solemya velesiana gill symbiont]|uniref:Aspartyl protease n=1 Tax=Solemya velesiana gill symbiont TaxID=1918948 RepID=A0A1T2KXC0_9GAMM|nr:TIGR02281 family clan AA aspartic protease [Solemya velesiana gill symbiont]OOZ37507.1 aspartyl protease [Solemya velesiana gill symbiont]